MEATQETPDRNPRGEGELLRERLIDAALAMLDEGHERSAISIRGVTRRAGVSPTAFYLHFDSRGELMRALVERGFTDFRIRLNAASSRSTDPGRRLIDAGVSYIEFAREQPERYRLIFSSDWEEEGIQESPDDELEVARAAFSDLTALIVAYVGLDAKDEAELDALALGLWSGLHGYVTLCHAQPGMADLSDEQYASLLFDAWLGKKRGS